MAWLEDNRTLVISDYHAAFVAEFDRLDITAAHLHGLRKRKGWKVGRAKGRTAGRHIKFSAAEIEWLRENCTMEVAAYHAAFCAEFNRADLSVSSLRGLRKRMKWKTGRTGRFEKGATSWNRGKKLGNNPGSARTQFKSGQLPHNTKYARHERVGTHGYVEISIERTNPHTGFERRYVLKHRLLWEKEHGPVPDDMVLKCKGDRLNTDPANWTLIPRGVLPRLNGGPRKTKLAYDEAPEEIRPAILAVALLDHRVRHHGRRKQS